MTSPSLPAQHALRCRDICMHVSGKADTRKFNDSDVNANTPVRDDARTSSQTYITEQNRTRSTNSPIFHKIGIKARLEMLTPLPRPKNNRTKSNTHPAPPSTIVKTANAHSSFSQSAPSRLPSHCPASSVADESPASLPAILPFPA